MSFERENTVLILDKMVNVDEEDLSFGRRYAHQLVQLSQEQLSALQAGKILAIDDQNEYVVYLTMENANVGN